MQDLNWCQGPGDPGDAPCIMSTEQDAEEYVGVQTCPVGGSAGTFPPDSTDADTCATGDPIIDSPEVSVGLRDLWQRSNADANMFLRTEQAGWIVRTSSGSYAVVPFTGGSSNFGCATYTLQRPAEGTIVAFVHTHPYRVDEPIPDCDLSNVQYYSGTPSTRDRKTSIQLGAWLGSSGPLTGYVIDQDGYYRFEGNTYTATPRTPRCGY